MFLRYFIIYLFIFLSGFGCTSTSKTTTVQTKKPVVSKSQHPVDKTHKKRDSDEQSQADSIFTYKSVNNINLNLYVYNPKISSELKNSKMAIVFFHGGSWTTGSFMSFEEQAIYLAQRGIVAISVEYRLKKLNGSTPFDSLADAKSAIRWIREHSSDLDINPNKIIVSGGSAGGHLAVSTAIIEGNNEMTDNLNISATPNALVLFNPVLDMSKWEDESKFNIDMTSISPLQQLSKPLPPTIIFQGTDDLTTPYSITTDFVSKALALKSSNIQLVPYQKKGHGFFNNECCLASTLEQTYNFIQGLGWNKK